MNVRERLVGERTHKGSSHGYVFPVEMKDGGNGVGMCSVGSVQLRELQGRKKPVCLAKEEEEAYIDIACELVACC
ncbi:hypothetical protein RHMOL_Rhmol05G0076500 [Rhododendron molle]|uniref:Uncharacterized protein n=1 Tax=Rhododendron molle TaxID=49168 RepID=A0ACC0NLS3_RHOML|nr:hypothetical protein RHMOL_Rhmol05G0076500 [Rhododendron molle]